MKIHHQGWNETVGAFNCDVEINEARSDYEIHFPDGTVFYQQTPFQSLPADWEQNGEPYSVFGAFFIQNGIKEFFTPLELASLALNDYAVIPGLQIKDHQENLADRIQAASNRIKSHTTLHSNGPAHAATTPIR